MSNSRRGPISLSVQPDVHDLRITSHLRQSFEGIRLASLIPSEPVCSFDNQLVHNSFTGSLRCSVNEISQNPVFVLYELPCRSFLPVSVTLKR